MTEEVIDKVCDAVAAAVRSVLSVAVVAGAEAEASAAAPVEEAAEAATEVTETPAEPTEAAKTTPHGMNDELTDEEADTIRAKIEEAMRILAEREVKKGGK